MKKSVSGSSTARNGPRTFIPISRWAGTALERNNSTNRERIPGLVLYVRISIIISSLLESDAAACFRGFGLLLSLLTFSGINNLTCHFVGEEYSLTHEPHQ